MLFMWGERERENKVEREKRIKWRERLRENKVEKET